MAADDAHYYRTADGTGLPHDPLNAIVGPRPIGWISSISATGSRNLAPYSFFNAFNYRPPLVGFSSVGWKDSVANIDATGEFVWNLATQPLAQAMNETSASVPPASTVTYWSTVSTRPHTHNRYCEPADPANTPRSTLTLCSP